MSRRTLRSAHPENGPASRIRLRCQQRVLCQLPRHQPLRTRPRSHAPRPPNRKIHVRLPRPRIMEEAPRIPSPPRSPKRIRKSRLRPAAGGFIGQASGITTITRNQFCWNWYFRPLLRAGIASARSSGSRWRCSELPLSSLVFISAVTPCSSMNQAS